MCPTFIACAGACLQAMDEGLVSRDELVAMFDEVHAATQAAFDTAVREPKVSVENAMKRLHRTDLPVCEELVRTTSVQELAASKGRRVVMRKAMTTVIEELLNKYKDVSEIDRITARRRWVGKVKRGRERVCVCLCVCV